MERFFSKIIKNENGCWIWQAFKEPKFGYGRFKMDRKIHAAHRVAWLLFRGPIPTKLFVCHKCDVPSCVNPDHLFLGTSKDNALDRDQKGRNGMVGKFGFKNAACKLTHKELRAIVRDKRSQTTIAKDYSISQSSVGRIKRGEQRRGGVI